MDRNYGGVIWTNHALQRMAQRSIKQSDAWAAFNRPDQSRPASTSGAFVYYKTYGNERLEVVASKNERDQWVIMSVWLRPIYSADRKGMVKETTWDRFLEKFLRIIFGRK